VHLADCGDTIAIHEATGQPGGRCRSYRDQATGMLIDNGTHLLLSGNRAAIAFTEAIGSTAGLSGPAEAEFSFIDLASDEQWNLRLGDGRFPWWVLDKNRRVPQTSIVEYLPLARLAWPSEDKSIGEIMNCSGLLYDRLLGPLLLAALNIAPRLGSTKLASALIRETYALSGQACRPLLARDGIGNVFVQPAIDYLRGCGVSITFEDELRGIQLSGERVTQLDFAERQVKLGKGDSVVLAVPPYVATKLVPNLQTPTLFCGIVNAHFRIDVPAHLPAMLGVVNGTCHWVFASPGRVSVTISDAEHLFDLPREQLAQMIWREVARITLLPRDLPPWQIVRERRATFAATPAQNGLRPAAQTAWDNLFLAGDWTATGLPATIESAIRSGNRAASLARHRLRAVA
jgi:squalene-associated FAD-dependent desaturase